MRTRNKVMAISLSVALASCLGLFCYLAVVKSHHSSDREAIDITSPDTLSVLEYDLGVISPGESKTQSIDIRSRVDFPIYYTVRFVDCPSSVAVDFFYVNFEISGIGKKESSLRDCFAENPFFERRIKSDVEERLSFVYSLSEEFPESILNQKVDFKIVIEAKNVIG